MTLYVRGRDVEEKETALRHDLGNWTILGEASEVNKSDGRKVILQCLADNLCDNQYETMTPSEVAGALGLPAKNVKQLLFKMAKAGEVLKQGRGRYIRPDSAQSNQNPATPITSITSITTITKGVNEPLQTSEGY